VGIKLIIYVTQTFNLHVTMSYLDRILILVTSYYLFIENQQMHQNDHFIVMRSQMLLHALAYQLHHQEAHMILTSYIYVGVHYRMSICWCAL
jgi:ABC-type Mn2+/Zn2+ transport system ATPase subunit